MKFLFITASDIYDMQGNGGVKGTQKNYKLLKEIVKDVELCVLKKNKIKEETEECLVFYQPMNYVGLVLAALFGCKRYYPWQEKNILKAIDRSQIDVLFLDSTILGRLIRKRSSYKTIAFCHNVEVDYAWNKVKNEGIQFLPAFWASKHNEKCAMKADKIGCLNERDSARLKELYGREADFILPVTFEDRFDSKRIKNNYKKEILFLGSFFGPNESAVKRFVKNVMSELPDFIFNVVGKGFEKEKDNLEKYNNVRVIGTVGETDEYYYRHAVVVMPIQYGAGMKVKTAEAMMFGKNILASDEALAGYEVDEIQGIYRCNTAEEYILAIGKIFGSEQVKGFQTDVRNCFLDKYETNCIKRTLEDVIESFAI